jgi:hypothetical protein
MRLAYNNGEQTARKLHWKAKGLGTLCPVYHMKVGCNGENHIAWNRVQRLLLELQDLNLPTLCTRHLRIPRPSREKDV